jgi:hypothetical protein
VFNSLVLEKPTFLAEEVAYVSIRSDGAPGKITGTGRRNDPYDGSSYQSFDFLMSHQLVGRTVILGPGIFQTQGIQYSGGTTIVHAAVTSSQRIIGSGIYSTFIQFVRDRALTKAACVLLKNAPLTSRMMSKHGR